LGLKICDFFEISFKKIPKNFLKFSYIFLNFFRPKNLWVSIPKRIEINSESKPKLILVLGLGMGVTQDPDLIFSFFLAECLFSIKNVNKFMKITA
jgi:hypothetical protein